MRVFISGGCKNGKSTYAQIIARGQRDCEGKLYYVATMSPGDDEDLERIRRHRTEREGWGFETVEIPAEIESCLPAIEPRASVLLDSVTALLANEMFPRGKAVDAQAARRVARELETLVDRLERLVVVSDAVYSDAFLYDGLTETFRRGLALIDRTLSRRCEVVLEACFGSLVCHKGGDMLKEIYGEIF